MAKIGEGHAAAMGRLGLKELRNAFNPSRESAAATDQGLYGEVTPGDVDRARKGDGPDQEPASLASLRSATREAARGGDDGRGGDEPSRGMEM